MGRKFYLYTATATFGVASLGADLFARATVAGDALVEAFTDYVQGAAEQFFAGTFILFAPFLVVALVCAKIDKRARTTSAVAIFAVAMIVLTYFYFEGYVASQHALLEKKWTAAALSIGLLPFFIGIPLVIVVAMAGMAASILHRRKSG